MGKSQKKKAIRRHNPVRVPDSHLPHGLAIASSSSSKTEAVLPVIQKLGSADTAERVWACAAVSNLIQNDPSTRRLLQGKNIVGTLITRLTDAIEEVVVEAAGSLRNLCIDGGYDICAEMYNKNIMAPLRTFPPKISNALHQVLSSSQVSPDGAAQKLLYQFAENIITILWCLSETSNKALKAVNDMKLTPFLMGFLQARNLLPISTVNAAAQCLYILSEENDPTINDLRTESAFVTCLLEIIQNESKDIRNNGENFKETRSITLRVLVSGILMNISPLPAVIPASSIDLENTILSQLVPLLSIDLSAVTATVMQLLAELENVDETSRKVPGNTPRTDHKPQPERELEYIEEKLRLVQLSIELLTNVCATLPEPEPLTGEMPCPDNEIDSDRESDIDLAERKPVGPLENVPGVEKSITRRSTNRLLSMLARPLIALVYPTTLSYPPSSTQLSPHPPTTSALSTIHIRALECLNNLFLAVEDVRDITADDSRRLSAEDVEGVRFVWDELWQALGKVGKVASEGKIFASKGLERKTEFWEIAAGVTWGIGKFGRGYLLPIAEQMQALMELCDATTDDLIKVRCIGALECLAQCHQAIDANMVISTYFLNHISSLSPQCVESCLQCVSALIDIYADESAPYDTNFRQIQIAEKLEHASFMLKKVLRGVDKRTPGGKELRERGAEVLENLAAFIDYRRALKL